MDAKLVTVTPDGDIYPFSAKQQGQRCLLVPLDAPPEESCWRKCRRFLEKLLSCGGVPATDAVAICKRAGFSKSIIRQTKTRMGIVSSYTGKPHHAGHWVWMLPEPEPDEPIEPYYDFVEATLSKLLHREVHLDRP